jgi:GH35 family endo-1,4-beta-xylanase
MLKKMLLGFALVLPAVVFADAPPGGKSVFSRPVLDTLLLGGQEGAGKAEKVKVEGQPFQEALRLSTFQSTPSKWDVQVQAVLPVPVKAGDVMLAEFWMRAVQTQGESGEAASEFVFERVGEPWTKAVEYGLSAGPQWKRFSIPFAAVEDLEAGKSHISFRMGYGPQVFDLAGLNLTSYGTKVTVSDLPQTQPSYDGMEVDAPWRKAAEERIEKIRKGDLVVTVKDSKGDPVPGVHVSVRMKRNAFGFGTAVVAASLATGGGENDRYQKEVERLFNRVVFGNDLKWGPWEEGAFNSGPWRRQNIEEAMKWLSSRDFDVRGHNLVWGSWGFLPGNIKRLENDKVALEKAIEDHIQDEGSAMKGQLIEWDVVNEPVTEHQLTDLLGKEALVTWYKKTKEVDPKALLFVNDYPTPDNRGHLKGYEDTIKFLLANGAPLEGIGLQGHVGRTPWSIPGLIQTLDMLGAHGLPVEITEYDTQIQDEALDAQFLKDFLTAVFSHPAASGFLMWGFWDEAHWHHKAPIFRKDWTEKPSGLAYEQLVLHDWWTNAEGDTGADGSYQVRGFCGEYVVTIKAGSKAVTVPAKLRSEGCVLSLVLK